MHETSEDMGAALAQLREAMARGTREIEDALAGLRELLTVARQARLRGQIQQAAWECERQLGRGQAFFSQAGQDAWLERNLFRGKRDGVFVEIGGYDGITGSNCLFFELMRGWTGLVIEPAPGLAAQCRACRRAEVLQVAVSETAGTAEFLEVEQGFRQMSGLTASYDPGLRARVEGDPRHRGRLVRVETRPLAAILDDHGLREVDYISLDVEGGEAAVLSSFPFDRFQVRAWSVENNTADRTIPALMQQNGYARVEALGVDDIYVRAEAVKAAAVAGSPRR
jgi:FkbM family methyltransferase